MSPLEVSEPDSIKFLFFSAFVWRSTPNHPVSRRGLSYGGVFTLFPPDFTSLQNILCQHQRRLTWELCGEKAEDEAPSRQAPPSFFSNLLTHSLFLSQVKQRRALWVNASLTNALR